MSIESMTRVLLHSRAIGTDKVVLLGIANHDGDGGAWPSIGTLSRYANVDPRQVKRAIKKLVAMGELVVHEQAGGNEFTRADRRPNRYVLTVPERGDFNVTPLDGVTSEAPRGDVQGANGVTSEAPRGVSGVTLTVLEPSSEPSVEPSTRTTARATFDDFWAAYPKKTSIGLARGAWLKATRKHDPNAIVEAARDYANDPNRVGQFTKAPHNWLDGECWHDDPLPDRSTTPSSSPRSDLIRRELAASLQYEQTRHPQIGARP